MGHLTRDSLIKQGVFRLREGLAGNNQGSRKLDRFRLRLRDDGTTFRLRLRDDGTTFRLRLRGNDGIGNRHRGLDPAIS
ncbi:MAG: hypothetical protein LBR51_01415 [Bacteroidales bacterium]|nr:hypothetical protein [Bacteroidales bacterium]